jgi:hypothetical protein
VVGMLGLIPEARSLICSIAESEVVPMICRYINAVRIFSSADANSGRVP